MTRSLFGVDWTEIKDPKLPGLSYHDVSKSESFYIGHKLITHEEYKAVCLLTHEKTPPLERSGGGQKIYLISIFNYKKQDYDAFVGYNMSFRDNNGHEWSYFGHGAFNVIYTTVLTRELVLKNGTRYLRGMRLAYRIPIIDFNEGAQGSPGYILGQPDRIERVTSELFKSRELMSAICYESGTLSPFIEGRCAFPAEISLGVLATFRESGRVVVDGISMGNFRMRDGTPICVDVAFGIRPGSPMSELFWRESEEMYQRWWRESKARYPSPINMIKALRYLQIVGIDHRLAGIGVLGERDDMVTLLAIAHDFYYYTKYHACASQALNDFFHNPCVDKVTEELTELLWLSSFFRYEDIFKRIAQLQLSVEKIKVMVQFLRSGIMTETIIAYDNNFNGKLFSEILDKCIQPIGSFPDFFNLLEEFLGIENTQLKQHVFSMLLDMSGQEISDNAQWLWQLDAKDREAFLMELMECDSFVVAKEYFLGSKREQPQDLVPAANSQRLFSQSVNTAAAAANALLEQAQFLWNGLSSSQ
jgi:hypothetical protein